MATHDLNLVYKWADWVFVMDRGKIVLEGKPQDVFTERKILEELELGVPLMYEIFCGNFSSEEKAVAQRLQKRMLELYL